MIVPAFLLRRLYVRGSLRNTAQGVEFDLKNSLGAGYAHEMLPLSFDGAEIPKEACSFGNNGETTPFLGVTSEKPFTLALNLTTTIRASGHVLSEGDHTIHMGFVVAGLGRLAFDFTDRVDGPASQTDAPSVP